MNPTSSCFNTESRNYEVDSDITPKESKISKTNEILTRSTFKALPVEICEEILLHLTGTAQPTSSNISVSQLFSSVIYSLLRRKNVNAKKIYANETLPKSKRIEIILQCLSISDPLNRKNNSIFKHLEEKNCCNCLYCMHEKSTADLKSLIANEKITSIEGVKINNSDEWMFWRQSIPKYLKDVKIMEFTFQSEFDRSRSEVIEDASVMNDEMAINQIVKLYFKKEPIWVGMFVPFIQVIRTMQFQENAIE